MTAIATPPIETAAPLATDGPPADIIARWASINPRDPDTGKPMAIQEVYDALRGHGGAKLATSHLEKIIASAIEEEKDKRAKSAIEMVTLCGPQVSLAVDAAREDGAAIRALMATLGITSYNLTITLAADGTISGAVSLGTAPVAAGTRKTPSAPADREAPIEGRSYAVKVASVAEGDYRATVKYRDGGYDISTATYKDKPVNPALPKTRSATAIVKAIVLAIRAKAGLPVKFATINGPSYLTLIGAAPVATVKATEPVKTPDAAPVNIVAPAAPEPVKAADAVIEPVKATEPEMTAAQRKRADKRAARAESDARKAAASASK